MSMEIPTELNMDILRSLSGEQLDIIGYLSMQGNTGANLSPYILGLFMDALLLGVVIMQFNRWVTYCYANESIFIKVIVFYVVIINIAITIFLVAWNFQLFVYNFGKYRQFISVDYASFFYLIDALVRFPVSAFFAERAWRMSGKNRILGAVLVTLLIACGAMGITAKVLATTIFGSETFIALSCCWLACHLASDAVTTSTIAICLWRSKTGWQQTDAIVMRLLLMTAETQLPPTLTSLAFLIVYVAHPHSPWPIFFVWSAPLFAICLLTVLNKKFSLRRELETASSAGGNNTYALKSRTKQPIQVNVMTETYRERDDYSGLDDDLRKPHDDVESIAGRPAPRRVKSDNDIENDNSFMDLDYDSKVPVTTVRFN